MSYPPIREDKVATDRFAISYDHASLTQTTTVKLHKASRRMKIEAVRYINPTGLAADNTNAFKCEIKNGSTLVASVFNTDGNDDPAGEALAADTFVSGTLVDADSLLAADDVLSVVFTEDGTATLPAGRLVIEARYL